MHMKQLLKIEKTFAVQFCISSLAFCLGSIVEQGKYCWPNDVGDIDLMVCSNKTEDVQAQENLEYVAGNPAFVKIKRENNEEKEQYLLSESLKAGEICRLSTNVLHLLQLISKGYGKRDGSIELKTKSGGAAYGFTFYNSYPSPSYQLEHANEKITDVEKSFFDDMAHCCSVGWYEGEDQVEVKKVFDKAFNKLYSSGKPKDLETLVKQFEMFLQVGNTSNQGTEKKQLDRAESIEESTNSSKSTNDENLLLEMAASSHTVDDSLAASSHTVDDSLAASSHIVDDSLAASSHTVDDSLAVSSHTVDNSLAASSHTVDNSLVVSSHIVDDSLAASSHTVENSLAASSHTVDNSLVASSHTVENSLAASSHTVDNSLAASSHTVDNSLAASSHTVDNSLVVSSHIVDDSLAVSSHTVENSLAASSHTVDNSLVASSHTVENSLAASSHTVDNSLAASSHTVENSLAASSHTVDNSLVASSHTVENSLAASSHTVDNSLAASSHTVDNSLAASSHTVDNSLVVSSHIVDDSLAVSSHTVENSLAASSHTVDNSLVASSHTVENSLAASSHTVDNSLAASSHTVDNSLAASSHTVDNSLVVSSHIVDDSLAASSHTVDNSLAASSHTVENSLAASSYTVDNSLAASPHTVDNSFTVSSHTVDNSLAVSSHEVDNSLDVSSHTVDNSLAASSHTVDNSFPRAMVTDYFSDVMSLKDPSIEQDIQTLIGQTIFNRVLVGENSKKGDQLLAMDDRNTEEKDKMFQRTGGMDIVPAYKCNGWPLISSEWLYRTKKWPSKEIVAKIEKDGVQLVAKNPQVVDQDEAKYMFRLSFSHAEKLLCHAMNCTQIHCYRVLKALHHEYFKPITERFTSYHIKTILFLACEEIEQELWEENQFGDYIILLLWRLQDALEKKTLQHYFIKDCNLLIDFTEKEINDVREKVASILDDPEGKLEELENSIFKIGQQVKREIEDGTQSSELLTFPHDLSRKTFRQLWMEKYDEICQECLHYLDVSKQIDEINPKFASSLNIFRALMEKELLSVDALRNVFTCIKDLLYTRHAMNFKDMKRDLYDLVLDDILIVADLSERAGEVPKDADINTLVLRGLESNGAEGFDISMLLPDGNDVIQSVIQLMFQ